MEQLYNVVDTTVIHHSSPPNSTLFPYTTLFRSRKKLRWIHGDSRRQEGQMIFMSHSDENREEFGLSKKHSHVAVKVRDRKSTRLNSSHVEISYAVFCLKKKINKRHVQSTHHI